MDLFVSSHTNECQFYCTLEVLCLWEPWGGMLLITLGHIRRVMFPPPVLVPLVLSKFLAECHRSVQTAYSSGTLEDGGSLASDSSQHVGRYFSLVSHHNRPCHGCFSRLGAQGSVIVAFNPLAAHLFMLCG